MSTRSHVPPARRADHLLLDVHDVARRGRVRRVAGALPPVKAGEHLDALAGGGGEDVEAVHRKARRRAAELNDEGLAAIVVPGTALVALVRARLKDVLEVRRSVVVLAVDEELVSDAEERIGELDDDVRVVERHVEDQLLAVPFADLLRDVAPAALHEVAPEGLGREPLLYDVLHGRRVVAGDHKEGAHARDYGRE